MASSIRNDEIVENLISKKFVASSQMIKNIFLMLEKLSGEIEKKIKSHDYKIF